MIVNLVAVLERPKLLLPRCLHLLARDDCMAFLRVLDPAVGRLKSSTDSWKKAALHSAMKAASCDDLVTMRRIGQKKGWVGRVLLAPPG